MSPVARIDDVPSVGRDAYGNAIADSGRLVRLSPIPDGDRPSVSWCVGRVMLRQDGDPVGPFDSSARGGTETVADDGSGWHEVQGGVNYVH